MRGRWLVLAVVLAGARPSAAEEVVETFEDGTPRLRFGRDEQGRRHGTYLEYFPGGQVAVRGSYSEGEKEGLWTTFHPGGKPATKGVWRAGRRDGSWEAWAEDGRPARIETWRLGRRHGKLQAWRDGRAIVEQEWRDGSLASLDGVPAFPVAREALERDLAPLRAASTPTPDAEALDLAADRRCALARLQAYRCLCGLAWSDMSLDPALEAKAQAASRICAALGRLTHDPPNPGWSAEEYAEGAEGAKGSNLHGGGSARHSVDSYMDDSDARNLDRLGHRTWCLHPQLQRTGFGVSVAPDGRGFSAMWCMDGSRTPAPRWQLVAYPPPGWVPVDLFGARHAWSAAFPPARFPGLVPEDVRAEIQPLDADFVPAGPPLALDYALLKPDGVVGPMAIFRPAAPAFTPSPGSAYRVRIGPLGSAPAKRGKLPPSLTYVVAFYAP